MYTLTVAAVAMNPSVLMKASSGESLPERVRSALSYVMKSDLRGLGVKGSGRKVSRSSRGTETIVPPELLAAGFELALPSFKRPSECFMLAVHEVIRERMLVESYADSVTRAPKGIEGDNVEV
jgi:hypothetical protein